MGLFGGDKKKKPASGGNDDEKRKRSRSRRVVAPGAARSGSGSGTDKRHATSRVKRGGGRPSAPAAEVTPDALDSTPQSDLQGDDDVLELDLESNSGGHQVIDIGNAGMGGEVSAGGVCRTGDAALLDFLVNKASLISDEQVAQAQQKAQEDDIAIDVACTRLGFFNEDQLVKSLTEECWVPHLKVEKYAIRKKALDTIGQMDAIAYGVLPVDKLGSILNLAMVNPLDVETIRLLEQKTGLDIKKVVATRSEIEAGISKYYGGEESGEDVGIGIEQDIPSQRVTQMLANVESLGEREPTTDPGIMAAVKQQAPGDDVIDIGDVDMEPAPAAMTPAPNNDIAPVGDDLDDIIDIDDLLGAEEAIEPVAIQPISISADEFDADEDADLLDATVTASHTKPAPVEDILAEPTIAAPEPELEPELSIANPGISQPSAELELEPDEDESDIEPAIDLAAAQDASEDLEELDLEEDFDDAPAIAAPAAAAPAPSKPDTSPALERAPERAPEKAPEKAPERAPAKRKAIVDLVPVREEEFQHAISHGKARVFEKWVAIQTRNRILNAVPVDPALDEVLASLYAEPTVAATAG